MVTEGATQASKQGKQPTGPPSSDAYEPQYDCKAPNSTGAVVAHIPWQQLTAL